MTVEDRLYDRHFPWHYTEFGVVCACGRPCDGNEECAVVRRTLRTIPPVPTSTEEAHRG